MGDKFTGDLKTEKFEQSDSKSVKSNTYIVMFKQNRTFELSIGRSFFVFPPYGKHELTEDQINHPDFIQQKKYFSVRQK